MSSSKSTDSAHRSVEDLNGTWEFATDPDDAGLDEEWHRSGADWPTDVQSVDVPHAWQEIDEYLDYTGAAWYRRTVEAPDLDADERAILRFGAVDYEATVWVNGTEVGDNREGYLPFEFDVTDALADGESEVVVRVFDPQDMSEIPHGKQGEPWYTRVSGIWQDVTLETRPETRVSGFRATPDLDDDTATIDAELVLDGTDPSDLDGEVVVERDGDEVTTASLSIDGETATATVDFDDPTYWTPETPALYDVTIRIESDGAVLDEYADYFGMRSVSYDDDQLYLNGEPYYMRGALDQGYYPETLYRPFDDDLFAREVEIAKELGFNLLRKHIKPAHPDFLEEADRQGLLVWEEPANPSVYSERSKEEVRAQLRGMIDRDYNRPSVIVWSLYNEEWGIGGHYEDGETLWEDEEKQEYLADLYERTQEWDPSRLICDNSGWAHVATDLNDYHRYFVSPDRAEAWSDDLDAIVENPGDNYGATMTDPEESPILVSEFGTWGLCDVDALRERYDGDPHWFYHEFLEEGLKRPTGVDERFEETNLPDVFEDLDDLAETWQPREFISVKNVIEEMRCREGVAGYVITEFSDIEWEFNGILDYLREEKSFHDDFAAINDDVLVRLDPDSHVAWAGEEVSLSVTVVNDTTESIDGSIELAAFGETIEIDVDADGYGIYDAGSVDLAVPDGEGSYAESVEATLETPTGTATNEEPVTVVGGDAGSEGTDASVYAADELAGAFEDAGYDVVDDVSDADVAVVTELSDGPREYAEAGNSVVLVPEADGHVADTDAFELRDLPETESWNLVASLLYQDSDYLDDLVDSKRLDWAFEGLYPYDVVADLDDEDTIEVASVEGWLSNWSSPLVERDLGDGSVTACTFRVTDAYGDHPVATRLLDRLVADRSE